MLGHDHSQAEVPTVTLMSAAGDFLCAQLLSMNGAQVRIAEDAQSHAETLNCWKATHDHDGETQRHGTVSRWGRTPVDRLIIQKRKDTPDEDGKTYASTGADLGVGVQMPASGMT